MKVKASYEDILELLNKRGLKVDFEKKEISLNRNVVYLQSYSNLVRLLYLLDDLLNQSK
jgi:hypothetical protein